MDASNEHANRFLTCVSEMRKLAKDRVDPKTGKVAIKASEWPQYHFHVSAPRFSVG